MAVAATVAIVTGIWWWIAFRVQVVLISCGYVDTELHPPGLLCPEVHVDWTRRAVAATFFVSVITLIGTASVELAARWRASGVRRSLRTPT